MVYKSLVSSTMIRRLDIIIKFKKKLQVMKYLYFTLKCSSFSTTPRTKTSSKGVNLYSLNKQISHFIRTGRINEARALFDKMGQRNTVTWNSMITGYVKRGDMTNARKLFDQMPERDVISWNLMISGYVSCRGKFFFQEGRNLFDRMPERSYVSWNTMISGYTKNGRMDEALRLFYSMPEKNSVSWNAMVSGFLQNGDVVRAIEFFKRMPERDAASMSALVSGLIQNGQLDEAERILLDYGSNDGLKEDLLYAYNTLIAGYAQRRMVDEARNLFNKIPVYNDQGKGRTGRFQRNVVSWNTMIMCYVKAADIVSARVLFDQMLERDSFSWNTIISGYVHVLNMEEASDLFSKMPSPDTHSWNLMIAGYAQIGSLELARDFFGRMPHKNLISWNSMIAACDKNGDYKGAINHFIQMQLDGEKPDRHTLSSLLSVSSGIVDLQLGVQIHQLVSKMFVPDVPLNNALITMYSKCGAITEARTIFDEVKLLKEVISWNAMIGGYASHGYATDALELFKLMKSLQVKPTYITFISVLNACAHSGLVAEGRMIFKCMVSDYGIEPRVEHFASLVDILGRQGELKEALDIISNMPIEPDKAVWGALLGGSIVHKNPEIARVAAEALMKLEPDNSGPYVLLRNMYADMGQWDYAREMRMMMDRNNVKKAAAFSWVDSS